MKYSMKKYLSAFLLTFLAFGCAHQQVITSAPAKLPYEVSYGKDPHRTQASPSVYKTSGLCNGLPRVQGPKLAPGFCLGLVDTGEGLGKPRFALQVDATHLLLLDMGGWTANTGALYMLTLANHKWTRRPLLTPAGLPIDKKCILDRPHELTRGPNGEIYMTSISCIATIRPLDANVAASVQIKLSGLPTEGLHALKSIVFDAAGNMLMNVGSITDNCELESSDTCKEREERAQIRKYIRLPDGSYDSHYIVWARGQRNSMALYFNDKNNELWSGENARDYIERKNSQLNGQEKPSDEFNITTENSEMDWPYCYDSGLISPEFPHADCNKYIKPHLLFPAHSAPLTFLMYTGNLLPAWYQNRLLVVLHGYKSYGHRIVTYKRDADLRPVGEPLSIVYDWEATSAGQFIGSPVSITQGLDGSMFIVEDTSAKVLQLYYNASEGNGTPIAELKVGNLKQDQSQLAKDFKRAEDKRKVVFDAKLKQANVPLFTQIQSQLLDVSCSKCHAGLSYPGMQILKYDDIGNYKKLKDILMPLLTGNGMPKMPLGGLPDESKDQLMALVQKWIAAGSPAP
jgi:glucose/arabinose dehydrogenase